MFENVLTVCCATRGTTLQTLPKRVWTEWHWLPFENTLCNFSCDFQGRKIKLYKLEYFGVATVLRVTFDLPEC